MTGHLRHFVSRFGQAVLVQLTGSAGRERALKSRVRDLEFEMTESSHQRQMNELLRINDWQGRILQRVDQRVPGLLAEIVEEDDLA